MSSIIRDGDTFHGISVFGRGVFKDKYGMTYAGQCKDGHACGLGVATWPGGSKVYAEHGPNGQCDGRHFGRDASGGTGYRLFSDVARARRNSQRTGHSPPSPVELVPWCSRGECPVSTLASIIIECHRATVAYESMPCIGPMP